MFRNALRKRLVRGTLFAATCASFPIGIVAGLVYLIILHEQDVIRRTEPDWTPTAGG